MTFGGHHSAHPPSEVVEVQETFHIIEEIGICLFEISFVASKIILKIHLS